jgi:SAM-dependent methyltransferase
MLRKIYYLLNPGQRLMARRLAFLPIDVFEKTFRLRDKHIPPRGMIFTGTGDFIRAGRLYLTLFIKHGGLQPNHRVLDVGSGIGRMALPLGGYLNETGSYEGFDIVQSGVNWCSKNITSRHPNFKFRLVHLKNDLYSLEGNAAEEFSFPYPDNEFDFVFLTSVFTHMVPAEVENYMKEISRVLKPGGHCFATFFVFGDDIPKGSGRSYFSFPIDHGYFKLLDPRVQSANVAFNLDYIKDTLATGNQLKLHSFVPGYWRDLDKKKESDDFQDIIVFQKG